MSLPITMAIWRQGVEFNYHSLYSNLGHPDSEGAIMWNVNQYRWHMTDNYYWWCHSVKGSLPPPLLLCAGPPARLTFDRHFFRVSARSRWQFVAVPGQKLNMGQYLYEWTWRKKQRERERIQWRSREWDTSFRGDTEGDKKKKKHLRNNLFFFVYSYQCVLISIHA